MPTTRLPSTTGKPEMPCCPLQRDHVAHRHVGRDGDRVAHHAGLEALDLGHFGGLLAWATGSCGRCRCRLPAPWRSPGRASVTVSIAAETQRDVQADVAGEPGREGGVAGQDRRSSAGTSSTSSNVSAFWSSRIGFLLAQKRIIRRRLSCERMRARVAFRAAARHLESPQARNLVCRGERAWRRASARMIRTVSLAALLLALALPASAQWAWKDRNGRLVYSDQAAAGSVKPAQIVRQPGGAPAVRRRAGPRAQAGDAKADAVAWWAEDAWPSRKRNSASARRSAPKPKRRRSGRASAGDQGRRMRAASAATCGRSRTATASSRRRRRANARSSTKPSARPKSGASREIADQELRLNGAAHSRSLAPCGGA